MNVRTIEGSLRRAWRAVTHEVRSSPPTAREHAVDLVWLGIMLVTTALREGDGLSPIRPALAVLVVLAWAPLLARTRWPLPVLVLVVAAETVHIGLLPLVAEDVDPALYMAAYQPVPLATMLAVWTVVTRTPRLLGWTAALMAAATLSVGGLVLQGAAFLITDLVVLDLVVLAAAAGAVAARARERTARRSREQALLVHGAVRDERVRIARELHDVLAHHLTLVNAQAGVAEYLLASDPAGAGTALRGITDHTSRAIDELRVTVGLLRDEDDDSVHDLQPVPGLRRLAELLRGMRDAGTEVTASTTGDPVPLDEHADLAAFRIVQEALTNATKHAPGAPAEVRLSWSPTSLSVEVRNALRAGAEPAPGTGHGMIGMRERARAAGGTFDAGPSGGHFVVHATIPAGQETR